MEGQQITLEAAGTLTVGSCIRVHNGPHSLRGRDLFVIGHRRLLGERHPLLIVSHNRDARPCSFGFTLTQRNFMGSRYDPPWDLMIEVLWVAEHTTTPEPGT